MKKIIQILVMIIAVTLTISYSYSQIDCPNNTGWTSSTASYGFGDYGPGGQASYQYISSGGVYQIKMNWGTFQNNSDFMPDNALKKVLETEAVRSIVPQYQFAYECDVYVYFIRECKVRVKLVLDLVRNAEVPCSDPGVTYCQNWYSRFIGGNQHSLYNIYQYITCGYKCCARVYHCTRWYDNAGSPEQWKTSGSLPTTVSITTCSGISSYRDCLPPYDFLPCEDGSCDGYN